VGGFEGEMRGLIEVPFRHFCGGTEENYYYYYYYYCLCGCWLSTSVNNNNNNNNNNVMRDKQCQS
jgi:hypothetical protein